MNTAEILKAANQAKNAAAGEKGQIGRRVIKQMAAGCWSKFRREHEGLGHDRAADEAREARSDVRPGEVQVRQGPRRGGEVPGINGRRDQQDVDRQSRREAGGRGVPHRRAVGKTAELASTFLHKGSLVFVEGRLETRSWTDKNGVARKATEIIVEDVQFGTRPTGQSAPAEKAPGAGEQVDDAGTAGGATTA